MKNKGWLLVFALLFPALACAADGSLSFTPQPSDLSVIFLGNIFGVVDGVLHGTGSQIMGSIFSVFNSAVLALGGIIIMYTLLVSTMNTAHEGQMLGQKWSSLWIPIRSTLGLALLIPKASGYCLMQIFVMWIVVQGIGAADKIWNAALSYLNRGGVIITTQMPANLITGQNGGTGSLSIGAQRILENQVCMLGIQKQFENSKASFLKQKEKDSGPCAGDSLPICTAQIPDFIGSVNIVQYQRDHTGSDIFEIPMPNFDKSSPFYTLNGQCGSLSWKKFGDTLPTRQTMTNLTENDLETAKMSRAIALQQMYLDLAPVARVMINNSPPLNPQLNVQTPVSSVSDQPFGVPENKQGDVCKSGEQCFLWGGTDNEAPLLNGTEFRGSLSDYSGIMLPALNLIEQAKDADNSNQSRAFIADSSKEGWIMAGSYFFNLVKLNQAAMGAGNANRIDMDSGLDQSKFSLDPQVYSCDTLEKDLNDLKSQTQNLPTAIQVPLPDNLQLRSLICKNLENQSDALIPIQKLITGKNLAGPSAITVSENKIYDGPLASTVRGYISNTLQLTLPDQPGQQALNFGQVFNFQPDGGSGGLPEVDFPCGTVTTFIFTFCLGEVLGDIFYNVILRTIFNFVASIFHAVVDQFIHILLTLPLAALAFIFQDGLKKISEPGNNPIVALAQMGTFYINFAGNFWETLFTFSLMPMSWLILPVMALGLPLIMGWMGIMVAIGFTTAYYIPVLPYLIFTFGAIAWLMAVIEAMVAAPIVALGVTHPEGHDAFGKGEQAIMILMNVFLRPAMMIIGYIAAISVSYVGIWILNAGFDRAIGFMQGGAEYGTTGEPDRGASLFGSFNVANPSGAVSGGYVGWAGMFGFFFSILIYTTTYLTIVQKAFGLIVALPDKVLRWIGGQPETIGQEVERWAGEVQSKVGEGEKATSQAMGAISRQLTGHAEAAKKAVKKAISKTDSNFS
jgi:defect-in-organelle-trafficking protein DotA